MNIFLKYTFLAFLVLAKPIFLQAHECGNIDPKWKKCSVTRDCVLIENSCGSLSDPVSRNFKMQAMKANKCLEKYVDCMNEMPKSKFTARCIKNICQATEIKK